MHADLVAGGAKVASALGDLATEEGASAVAAAALDAFGGIDVLVNNAGGASEEAKKSWFDVDLGRR